jgi:tetratricopeptide (TPR) repeat protein
MITLFSYWYSKYKNYEDSKYLDKFLKQFRALPTEDDLKVLISSGELSEKSWMLLASSYYKNGDYEKSIEIYNELLSVQKSTKVKETMFLLGKTYFKAGFLQRSKQIFLEILKHSPRTPHALKYLLLVYEYMRDFSSAKDVLEPLDELDNDIAKDENYLNVLIVLNDETINDELKAKKLLDIYEQTDQLFYMIFEYLFRVDAVLAWRYFDSSKSELLLDVLWGLEYEKLNFDIISSNGYLRELYSARGDVDLADESSIFEFDLLIKLKNKANATLSFEYICHECKSTFPFSFNRCTHCHSIDTQRIEWSLCKDYFKDFSEENNSFQ